MTISLTEFLGTLSGGSPFVILIVLLTLGVILVNGWTDAPNAITACVSPRSMKLKNAIIMAASILYSPMLVSFSDSNDSGYEAGYAEDLDAGYYDSYYGGYDDGINDDSTTEESTSDDD